MIDTTLVLAAVFDSSTANACTGAVAVSANGLKVVCVHGALGSQAVYCTSRRQQCVIRIACRGAYTAALLNFCRDSTWPTTWVCTESGCALGFLASLFVCLLSVMSHMHTCVEHQAVCACSSNDYLRLHAYVAYVASPGCRVQYGISKACQVVLQKHPAWAPFVSTP